MKEEELLYALALQRAKGIGDINAKKLIETCGSPKSVLKERKNTLSKINGIGAVLIKNLFDPECLKQAEKELSFIRSNNIKPLYFQDKKYPNNLKNCIDGPFLLFQDGEFDFDNSNIISVVGTRNMTNYGRDFCKELISGLKDCNPTIISGFAYGVDICAHKAALDNGLQTIAVFAHGFDQVYPKIHKKYMAKVYENGGFLTEFWSKETPLKENFLKRNRIVAGISQATVVIESAARGGSLATATIANSYSRDVFALPGRSSDIYSKGCNNLIKTNKAALITSADDLKEMLGWTRQKQAKVIQPQLFVELTDDEQIIIDFLKQRQSELLDIIALDCGILVHKTASTLFQLEMKGLLKALPGKIFEIV
ncbi:DNA-processing protein DprA [Flavicella sp.]|uniref:DNA-processing protein DprA n=1 Tax=Flavicella sp. TaxID=2957742 RepID=UPI00301719FC